MARARTSDCSAPTISSARGAEAPSTFSAAASTAGGGWATRWSADMPLVPEPTTAVPVRAIERRDEWKAIVRAFPACDVRHAWQWGELRARQGWRPLRLAAFAGG